MRLEVERYRLLILPDPGTIGDHSRRETDVAYIEEVLGLRKDGDEAIVRRVNATNLFCLAYLEVSKKADKKAEAVQK